MNAIKEMLFIPSINSLSIIQTKTCKPVNYSRRTIRPKLDLLYLNMEPTYRLQEIINGNSMRKCFGDVKSNVKSNENKIEFANCKSTNY